MHDIPIIPSCLSSLFFISKHEFLQDYVLTRDASLFQGD